MKLAAVGIGLFRQAGVTVPHSFLSDTRRRSGLLKQCTEGDPQGVKIVFGRIRNTRGNPIRFQLVKWKEGPKYSFGMRNAAICPKSFHKLRTQRNNGLLAVFGIAFINDKSWIIRFKLYIAPQKGGIFPFGADPYKSQSLQCTSNANREEFARDARAEYLS